jgi:exodeoxyribonuclease III
LRSIIDIYKKMKIISYNLNGIRSALSKGLTDWLTAENPDIIGLQELKAQPHQIDEAAFAAIGYPYCYWHSAEKPGYSGVAILSKTEPTNVVVGCGIAEYDREGRVLRADFGDLTVLSCYFPSGASGDERQAVKMRFLADIQLFINDLRKSRPNLIILGDYNIAHQDIDIHNPKGNKKTSGFLPEERDWLTAWLDAGLIDAFRHCNPALQTYSWWSTRFKSRAQDKGWRIDYASVSPSVAPKLRAARHANEAVHSDHCPVVIELDY